MAIHPTAVVDRRANVDPTAEIGPYAIIDGPVCIGPGTKIYPHAYLTGWTEIGANCRIHPFAVVGHEPQDLAFKGEESYCRIGDETIIREGVSIHRGTDPGSATVVGEHCFIMANAHVAHNCQVGDDVKLVNLVALGGHVHVASGAFLGGGVEVHQFCRIGELVMVRGLAEIYKDVPPYFLAARDGYCAGLNVVGMRRAGFTPEQRQDVQQAYRILYRSGIKFTEAVEKLADAVTTDAGRRVLDFVREPSKRGFARGPRTGDAIADE